MSLSTLLIQGCMFAPLATSFAGSGVAVQTTVASGASYATTGKTLGDHALSGATDKDCKLFNLIDGQQVCQNYKSSGAKIDDRSHRPESKNETLPAEPIQEKQE